jgi:hypothetical protein
MTMPDLLLQRREHDGHATLGRLHAPDNHGGWRPIAWTLENRPPRQPGVKEAGKSRIPAGEHRLGLRAVGGFYERYTNRWPSWHGPMVEVLLPGWKYVLFHTGNYHRHTDGCILVGDDHGRDLSGDGALAVWKSRMAYQRIYPFLLTVGRAVGTIRIEDEA